MTTGLADQAGARRRLRRRTLTAGQALYCSTNGCATTLQLDAKSGIATCRICGFRRRTAA